MSSIRFDDQFFGTEWRDKAASLGSRCAEIVDDIRDGRCLGGEWTGWWSFPKKHGYEIFKEAEKYRDELDVSYDYVLVIGIGGSYLGTRAVVSSLQHTFADHMDDGKPMVGFLGQHLSEAAMIETLDLLAERLPVVNVISKSGTTTEPSVAFRIVRQYLEERFGEEEAAKRIVVTTDREKGALRELAQELGYRSFVVPDDVGGRYSVLTAVGIVPLVLAKFDVASLLNGAQSIFDELEGDQIESHPALRYASARHIAYQEEKRIEILSYLNPKLNYLVEWWKQLFGESEGKEGKGLFPSGLAYTTDLHSLGQYVQEGHRNLLETFLHFEKESAVAPGGVERRLKVPHVDQDRDKIAYLEGRHIDEINHAAMVATKIAHFDGGVPCLEIRVPELSERSIGALFAFFEVSCAVSCLLLNVNPFDQPGVEAYKKNLFALMGRPGYSDLETELKARVAGSDSL